MTGAGVVAVATTAGAVALVVPGVRVPGRLGASGRRPRGPVATALVVVALAAIVLATGAVPLGGDGVALVGIGAGTAWGVRRRALAGSRTRAAAVRRQRVVELAEALCGELTAGQPVADAVHRAVVVWPEAAPVARAALLGADVPQALRALARSPGAEGVVRLAAAWELSASSGAGLAQASRRVLDTARARQATERLVQAEVASARATARLVCGLPVVVLLAAQGAGAQPWSFLLSTPVGLACLASGLALSFAGLAWIDRIAAAAVDGAG